MSQTLEIPADDHGKIRVFAISVAPELLQRLTPSERLNWLSQALGGADLTAHAELFPVSDLDEVGLAGYLSEGHGIDQTALAPDLPKLAALSGWVAVLPSTGLATAGTLPLAPEVTLIATYSEPQTDWTPVALETDSAAPHSAPNAPVKKPMSDARIGGMVATAVLLFLAVFVIIFVWIGG